MSVSRQDVEQARETIRSSVRQTPVVHSDFLSQAYGCQVYLKLENLQRTGAFKERGAFNKLMNLSEEDRQKGVIAASAGNHAQGVAYGARKLGMDATIVMPRTTPLIKVQATKSYGAEVILEGESYDDAYMHALKLSEEKDVPFIHPFADPLVIAGQGTVAMELLEESDMEDLDIVICAIGGGGLISGMAAYLKDVRPDIQLIGVEAESCPAMKLSVDSGKLIQLESAATLADGIAVKKVSELTYEMVHHYVDDIVTVSENDIANAVLQLLENEKILVEGAGAATLAALHRDPCRFKDKKVVLIMSGGNIDVNRLNKIITRGLAVDGRICRLRIRLHDVPGRLSSLSTYFDNIRVNILEIQHHRVELELPYGFVDVTVTLETKGFDHIETIRQDLTEQGYEIV
ncbi:threonine ammonia-lyase [bacterium]|jgi:threonine dehydratase|nr:threonine ammonia-lyase [bacterium]